jgi:hypothetical protein
VSGQITESFDVNTAATQHVGHDVLVIAFFERAGYSVEDCIFPSPHHLEGIHGGKTLLRVYSSIVEIGSFGVDRESS